MSNPVTDPVKSAVDAYKTVRHLLDTLKTLDQKLPQVIEAMSLIAQLQADIMELSARNSQLERELTEAERHNFELSKTIQTEEAWRAELEKLEKCQTENGKWVFREQGTTEPFYCPSCLNDRKKNFLQRGHHRNINMNRLQEGDYCPVCQRSF